MGKYDKYFIKESKLAATIQDKYLGKIKSVGIRHRFNVTQESDAGVPGAFLMEAQVVLDTTPPEMAHGRPHSHDFDEYMAFASMDPEDMTNLGGEVEFWMEGEKHVITESTSIFIPRFILHLPINITRVDRPFMWITTANTIKYSHFQYSKDPEWVNEGMLDEIAEVTLGGKKYQVTKSYLDYLEYLTEKSRKERGL